ncbi:AtpZ/AtpI family protein [Rothia uropygialis]|uniref:AtpZ/AtpI family protein n=1 Tax=Kocuria sp. 36 TaxID=1415402 RepID=UPI001EE88312|nr:AtpZ/AtpI family protein [Kocuria sp. 36]
MTSDRQGGNPRSRAFRDQPEKQDLRNAGDLVNQGGLSGSIMVLLYVVIGTAFWSLVGFGLDRLLGTRWIVWLGAGIGAFAGFYLVYLHMRPRDGDD